MFIVDLVIWLTMDDTHGDRLHKVTWSVRLGPKVLWVHFQGYNLHFVSRCMKGKMLEKQKYLLKLMSATELHYFVK